MVKRVKQPAVSQRQDRGLTAPKQEPNPDPQAGGSCCLPSLPTWQASILRRAGTTKSELARDRDASRIWNVFLRLGSMRLETPEQSAKQWLAATARVKTEFPRCLNQRPDWRNCLPASAVVPADWFLVD